MFKKIVIFTLLVQISLFSNNELINVNFKNLSLNQLIEIVSFKLDKKIILTNDIKGKVEFISNKPIKKIELLNILKMALNDNGYKLVENNGILRVIKKKKRKLIKTKKIKKLDKNKTELITLGNIDAKSVQTILNNILEKRAYKNSYKPIISIDEKSNFIILDGKSSIVNNLTILVKKLDMMKKQVYIKAKIIELDDNLVEEIGFNLGILGGKIYSGGLLSFSSALNDGTALINTSSIGLEIPNVSSAIALGATLNLLNRTYALDIISEPSILCVNNNEGMIYIGETVSIQTGNTITDGGSSVTVFERDDIGLTLNVKPRIYENRVTLNINTIIEGIKEQNSLNFAPNTSKKEVKTKAILNNGESVIIGGLIETKSQKNLQKVPFFSEIPLIGELFKNRKNNNQRRTLMVVITPYIIPEKKDVSFIRKELAKLKSLEDEFLKQILIELKEKNKVKEEKKEKVSNINEHKKRLKKYFGI